jgi:hypothetical protein
VGPFIRRRAEACTLVVVLKANDIFFAEQIAFLYFNYRERDRPRVFQSVNSPHWDYNRFEGAKFQYLLSHDDPRSSGDNNPVLAPVMVKLQTEAMSRPDFDKFHLILYSFV